MKHTQTKHIIIATIRPWNIARAKKWKAPKGYKVHIVTDPKKLTPSLLEKLKPKFVFFPHWSSIIPEAIFGPYECIVFHMTDLPFGRGGSPLQNLISRGIYKTKISALRVESGLDTGDIYLKRPFDLKEGSAEGLFDKVSEEVFAMMRFIVEKNPKPKSQQGEAVTFKRRTPQESRIPENLGGRALYDHIRMLDAPEYPPAFLEQGGMRYEYRAASLHKDGSVSAEVHIKSMKDENSI